VDNMLCTITANAFKLSQTKWVITIELFCTANLFKPTVEICQTPAALSRKYICLHLTEYVVVVD
jgi:hypothetical protein